MVRFRIGGEGYASGTDCWQNLDPWKGPFGVRNRVGQMAGEPGFEPRLTESESAVLPLDDSPVP
jgi:hypothetical protein